MDRSNVSRVIQDSLAQSNLGTEESRRQIAFHMTDWLDDSENWQSFCSNPDSPSAEEVEELLMAFLIHVPNHVAAASKLMLDIPVTDIFEVGATTESE